MNSLVVRTVEKVGINFKIFCVPNCKIGSIYIQTSSQLIFNLLQDVNNIHSLNILVVIQNNVVLTLEIHINYVLDFFFSISMEQLVKSVFPLIRMYYSSNASKMLNLQ